MSHLQLCLNYNSLNYDQAYLMLCHDRFYGVCKKWNDGEGTGLILVADRTIVQVNWTGILFIGQPILLPNEPLEFGIIVDSDGNRRAIYVTGSNGYYLNSNRIHKHKNEIIKNTERLNRKTQTTKHLIARLSGNLHPNGQLDENSKHTLKQWVEEEDIKSHKSNHSSITQQSNHSNTSSNSNSNSNSNSDTSVSATDNNSSVNKNISLQKQSNNCITESDSNSSDNNERDLQFHREICNFYASSRPNVSTLNARDEFFGLINKYIFEFHNKYYVNESWNIFKFGSSIWGIDDNESDIDVAIKIKKCNKYTKQKLLGDLSYYINNEISNNKLIIRPILHARYPIITIENIEINIKMDISICNDYCVENTRDIILEYINKYITFGYPMRKFIIFIKYWSKRRCINDSPNRFINSFGFTLMAIKYIQYLINKKKKYINLTQLMYGFYIFYGYKFNNHKYVIDIGYNGFNNKLTNKILEIIDPANINNNVTNNVKKKQFDKINLEFKRAAQIMKVYMKKGQTMHQTLFKLLTEKGKKMVVYNK